MFGSKHQPAIHNLTALMEAILKSKLKVVASSVEGTRIVGIDEILAEAKKAGKSVVFTFTPGPFKSTAELPKHWMETPAAIGCSLQLTAFQKAIKGLNAVVYAVNKQTTEYQQGAAGLLAVKGLPNLFMISDENNEIERELGLNTFFVEKKEYFERFSVAITPNGEGKVFEIVNPVTPVKAEKHVAAINSFLLSMQVEPAASVAEHHEYTTRRSSSASVV